MAEEEKKKKPGLFDRAVDALTTRDEKEAAAEAAKAAEEAKAEAAREAALRQLAEARAAEAERKAKEAEEAVKAAEAQARVAASHAKFEAEAAARKQELEKQLAEEAARIAEERAAAVQAAAEAKKRTYVVKPGDSLSKIAKEVYGDAHQYMKIFEANKDKIKNPNVIQPGMELDIPTKPIEIPRVKPVSKE